MSIQYTQVPDKYVKEATEEYNKSLQFHIKEDQANRQTVPINGTDYIVVDMLYEDFVKSQNGKDMDDIQWT